MNKIIIGIVAVALLAGGAWWWMTQGGGSGPKVTYTNADANMIVVDNVKPGVNVLPEFKVFGQARGTWYFEASFPVEVLDANGTRITMGHAEAQSDWMTEDFVPYIAEVKIENGYSGPATLVLHKDNPSGEPSRDASVSIPIVVQ